MVAWTPSDPNMSLFTTLILDVLDDILSFADIYDTFRLSLTCCDAAILGDGHIPASLAVASLRSKAHIGGVLSTV